MVLTYLSIKESVKSDQTSHLEQIRDSRFFALWLNTFFMCSFLSQPATGSEEIAGGCDPRWCRCFGIDEIHGSTLVGSLEHPKKKVDPVRNFMCLFQVEKSLPASSTSYLFLVIDAFGCVCNDALCYKSPKKDAGAIESKPAWDEDRHSTCLIGGVHIIPTTKKRAMTGFEHSWCQRCQRCQRCRSSGSKILILSCVKLGYLYFFSRHLFNWSAQKGLRKTGTEGNAKYQRPWFEDHVAEML